MTDPLDDFADLAIAARGRLFSVRPGRHGARAIGVGGAFAGLSPLMDHPDPRRIDVRATIRDPLGTIWVRRQRQEVAARIVVLLDTSGSMAAVGRSDRGVLARVLVAGLARAVERGSDGFGLLTGADIGPDAALWPPRRRRGLSAEVAALVDRIAFSGSGAGRLEAAADLLPAGRCVVLLVSDFSQPLAAVAALLDRLSAHDVRPIVLRDSAVEAPDGRFGIVELADLEGGGRRLVLMRPALARAQAAAAAERRRRLAALFADHGLAPVEIVDQIDVAALVDAFTAGGA